MKKPRRKRMSLMAMLNRSRRYRDPYVAFIKMLREFDVIPEKSPFVGKVTIASDAWESYTKTQL